MKQLKISHICNNMSKRQNILPTRTTSFSSSAVKIESEQKFKKKNSCFIADSSHIKNCMATYSSSHRT